uniref:TetR/AcrR family transcriptional regulator n=2 Tax=Aerococcaceae TaxID=186827 RepID=UPI00352B949B
MSLKDSSSRSRIIEVARNKFMSSGYKATSTRMIAKEVGITQPNLYYHFKNKESLYLGVLDEIGGEVYTDLLAIVENDQLDL